MSNPRAAALFNGWPRYFTGLPCKNGHISERETKHGKCIECLRKNVRNSARRHPETQKRCNRQYRLDHKKELAAQYKQWRIDHRVQLKEYLSRWNLDHKEEMIRYRKERYRAKRKDPAYRLKDSVRSCIRLALRGQKGQRHWEAVVDYTLEELKVHLESLFTGKMTWNNYGSFWHIDHIVPEDWFHKLCLSAEEKVRLAYSLVNLRPLSARENQAKKNKFIPRLANPVLRKLGLLKKGGACQTTQ